MSVQYLCGVQELDDFWAGVSGQNKYCKHRSSRGHKRRGAIDRPRLRGVVEEVRHDRFRI